ncbi:MAG: gamma-glutamyltransferase [Proteobacteria bacterium]|nr:gamma-glutamyltransferase [Pseudomonadota bacterium]
MRILLFFLCLLNAATAGAASTPAPGHSHEAEASAQAVGHPHEGSLAVGAVATAHPLATEAGASVLRRGGNAFDAAVAITAALAVVEPYSSGLGGGGFYLLYERKSGRYVFLDARERAPLAAHRDMYLDDNGRVNTQASIDGALAAGIPGIPAALEHLSKLYGSLDLKTLLAPAQRLAADGFSVDRIYHAMAGFRHDILNSFTASRQAFLRDGEVPAIGDRLVQADLARTLKTLGDKGASEFYRGAIAREMVRAVRAAGGIWTPEDLSSYKVIERQPIRLDKPYATIYSAPPPSSGAVALAQILGQLDSFGIVGHYNSTNASHVHLLIESMRRAYRDRSIYLGDSDFTEVPIARLISDDYTAGLAAGIHTSKASKSEWLDARLPKADSPHTTHFSVLDKQGNIVSATLSVNYPFGSGLVAGSTGVLLNDEMDDFSAQPGQQNAYGLIGSDANAIEPGKRMLSSMTPTIVRLPDRTIILGTPGGSRIITMVAQGILSALTGASADAISGQGRIHHQFVPDTMLYEPKSLSKDVVQALNVMGHNLSPAERDWGNMQVVVINADGTVSASSDRRGIGQTWVGKPSSEAE